MTVSRIIFGFISVLVIFRLYILGGVAMVFSGGIVLVILGSMIGFSGFLARYILPFGFWESKATDFKTSERSAPAIVFLGWVALLLYLWAIYVLL